MIPYILLILLIIIFQTNKFQMSIKWAMAALFIFSAFRGNGSGDYFTYIDYSAHIETLKDVINPDFPMEIGFRIISYVGNFLSLGPQFSIAAMNLISLSCIYYFIKNYSPDEMLSVLLFLPFFFQLDMHAARTAVAVSIGTVGFSFIKERKLIKFLLVVFFACLFHKTALILLLLYPLSFLNIPNKFKIVSIVLLGVVSVIISFERILLAILEVLPEGKFVSKLNNYLGSEKFGYDYNLLDPRFILLIIIFIFALYQLKGISTENLLLKNILWLNIILILFLRENMFLMTRINFYFNIYTIIIVPKIIEDLKIFYKNNILSYGFYKCVIIGIYTLYTLGIVLSGVAYKIFL